MQEPHSCPWFPRLQFPLDCRLIPGPTLNLGNPLEGSKDRPTSFTAPNSKHRHGTNLFSGSWFLGATG